jgi:hypothetical protein
MINFASRLWNSLTRAKNKPTMVKLLKGSEEIDRMRKEIRDFPPFFIGLLLELMNKKEPAVAVPRVDSETFKFNVFAGDGYMWEIFISDKLKTVTLIAKRDPFFRYSFGQNLEIPFRRVELIHGKLQYLVDGVLDKFPALYKQCEPFVKAANKAE